MSFQTCGVILPLSDYALGLLRSNFTTVHYYPEEDIPDELAAEVDIWYCKWFGLPTEWTLEKVPKTKVLQLASAGANLAVKHPIFKTEEGRKQISISTSSGIHVHTIPNYIIGQIIGLYTNLHTAVYISRAKERWPRRQELQYRAPIDENASTSPYTFGRTGSYTLRGRTAGMLGYGHIARETARILQVLGVNVIAANTSGERRVDDGYIVPGTGDEQGTIPSAYYSTQDPASFNEFLSKSDILIASLPSTPATTYLLTEEHFKALPKDALFINVGRGDLTSPLTLFPEHILAALDAEEGLLGAGLDVTDPEPLPDKHALLTHPRAVVTPHTSADTSEYFDHAAEMLVANVTRIRAGGKPMNTVDPAKGY